MSKFKLPSPKAFVDAHLVKDLIEGERVRTCLREGRLDNVNELIDTAGIETICIPEGAFNNCQTPRHTIRYFNIGDPYQQTLLQINDRNWFIGCWGDSLEQMELR
jgi:hypothetical protein